MAYTNSNSNPEDKVEISEAGREALKQKEELPGAIVTHLPHSVNRIVISLHGIRTRGTWQRELTDVLTDADSIHHVPLDYGWFLAIQTIIPFLRDKKVKWFVNEYTRIKDKHPDQIPSVIAHSFGTYLVARALESYQVKFDQIILCGSILPPEFDWKTLFDGGRVTRVLSERAKKDFVVRVAPYFIKDSGSSGVKGFSEPIDPRLCQRTTERYGHSDYLHRLNFQECWVPFLEGKPAPKDSPSLNPKKNRKFFVVKLLFILLILLALYLGYRVITKPMNPREHFKAPVITSLQTNGICISAAISPLGNYLAYAAYENLKQSLYAKRMPSNPDTQLTPPEELFYGGISFSPDGRFIYYVRAMGLESAGRLYQLPIPPGTPKMLLEQVNSPITFSPDGKRIAFVRKSGSEQNKTTLIVANADGTSPYTLATRILPDFFSTEGPAWSPDEKYIAVSVGSSECSMTVVKIHLEDGKETPITAKRWIDCGQVAWLSDNSGLVVCATEKKLDVSQIWFIAYPGGNVRKIINDSNAYRGLSITTDSSKIVTVAENFSSNVWVTQDGLTRPPRQITSDLRKYMSLFWMPSDRLVLVEGEGETTDLWIIEPGRSTRQLSIGAHMSNWPVLTPDDKYIIFASGDGCQSNIWRADMDGSNLKQMTSSNGDSAPQYSPDGAWIVYESEREGQSTLWKVPIDGGEPIRINDTFSSNPLRPLVSPDGRLIAYKYYEGGEAKMAIIPLGGGNPIKTFKIKSQFFRWKPDGSALTYIDNPEGRFNVWSQALAGGPPKQLTNLPSGTGTLYAYAWSPDGQKLAYLMATVYNTTKLISDSK